MEEKIKLTLTCLLKIYDIEKEKRERVINEILQTDYKKMGSSLNKQLVKFIEKTNEERLETIK